MKRPNLKVCIAFAGLFVVEAIHAEATNTHLSLNEKINNVKNQVLELNREIAVLEEKLFFPESTQISVLISSDANTDFNLSSIQLTIDDTPITSYLYTPSEITTLRSGGIQQVFIGNLLKGKHRLVATVFGKVANNKENRYIASTLIDKQAGAKIVELKIKNSDVPNFTFQIHN